MLRIFLTLFAIVAAGCTTPPTASSPYVGQESRDIKALSASEIEGLLEGKGLGYAKSAELNGYPGPAHVRELASELRLSPDQLAATDAIFARMQASARRLGGQLVESERALETAFRSRAITGQSLSASMREVSEIQEQLRNVHLQAHIEQTAIMDADQINRYISLRGYDQASNKHDSGKHSH